MKQRTLLAVLFLSAVAAPALADCYKVGPGGTHALIQPAVEAARLAGGLECIRVAAGHRAERVDIRDRDPGRSLALSGGWNADFTVQTGMTTLDGGGLAPVVQVSTTSGRLGLSRFRIINGNRPALAPGTGGGGLRLSAYGSAAVRLEDSEVLNNRFAFAGVSAHGGGLWAGVDDTASLSIVRTTFAGNAVLASPGQAGGGGAFIVAAGSARVAVLDSDFLNNEVSGPDYTAAGALDVTVLEMAYAEVSDNVFRANRTLSAAGNAWGSVNLQPWSDGRGAPLLEARRNDIQHNVVQQAGGHQLELRTGTASTLRVTDTLVANGSGTGVLAWPDGGTLCLTNLTVTRHLNDGARVIGGADNVFLANSILFGNGTDLDGAAVLADNLVGVDPLFLDPASGDFHLAPGSPAIDAGGSGASCGLGPLDLDRLARIQGWGVDQGAYETPPAPGPGGAPGCFIRSLGIHTGFPTGLCRCLTDDSLREFHCGFFLPELMVDMRFPFVAPEGQPLPVEWSIRPWTSVGSGAYSMRAEARIGSQWVPQAWLGPKAPSLKKGQAVTEPFRISAPAADPTPTPVRTLIDYPRRAGQPRGQFWMEVFLPPIPDRP
jgi:hypothetical protein